MKILFTSVGRRVELIQAVKNAGEKLNVDLKIYGADISDSAPALAFCDCMAIIPKIEDEKYIPELQKICKKENIDALIPTIDTDLMLLAKNRNNFGDTKVIISRPEKIAVCRDKKYTSEYFTSLGLKSPHTVDGWKQYKDGYPALIKPKDGSSSIFVYKVRNEKELIFFSKKVPNYIIQPFIDGTEYTVDIFCDFEGSPIFITPRIRLVVRSGEVIKTKIAPEKDIIEEMKWLVADYKPCGPITVQLIKDKITGENYYIEINPRFGGGAPLSMKAGADSAEALIMLLSGKKLGYHDEAADCGAIYSRFEQSIRVNERIRSF